MAYRKLHNKTIIMVSLIAHFLWTSVLFAQEGIHWVQFGTSCKKLTEVEEKIKELPEDMRNKLNICITNGEYALVHGDFGSFEKIEKTKQTLSDDIKAVEAVGNSFKKIKPTIKDPYILSIARYPKRRCFNASNYLKNEKRKMASVKSEDDKKIDVKPAVQPMNYRKDKPVIDIPIPLPPEKNKVYALTPKPPEILNDTTVHVSPDVTARVDLSNRDINRITCMGGRLMKNVVLSTEKGVTSKSDGSNAFIKFKIKKNSVTGDMSYINEPVELYVMCGSEGDTYTLIGQPKNITAQTVQLVSNKPYIRKNHSDFKDMPLEKKALEIIRQAYSGDFPESYTVKQVEKELSLFISKGRVKKGTVEAKAPNVRVNMKRIVEIEGEGLLLKEYALKLKDDYPEDEIKVSEKMFLLPELANSPVALALDPMIIGKKYDTRLFVLEAHRNDK
ncbi:MAG: type-F conjugative transfer system secretin TraK [Proteobacteria bacterium]|nr:type-F conjugative transfer system secretin TraK [Pseudomonadota bacterium]